VTPEASNLMLLDEQGRDRLVRTPRGWVTRRERQAMDEAQLLRRIEEQPQRFSPNVLLRPVVENAVFPTVAYVAGPAELAYFAQIGCLFEAHGMLPPVIVPRPSLTLVEPKVRALAERLGLEPDAFRRPFDQLVAEMARREMPQSVQRALRDLRAALYASYGELGSATADVETTLSGPVEAARNRALLQVHALETRIAAGVKRKNGVFFERLRRAAAQLAPDGVPQERALGPLPFVARYGRAFVPALESSFDMDVEPLASWAGPKCA
jgi:uncharacterized protein YllA (UPF0747 family)